MRDIDSFMTATPETIYEGNAIAEAIRTIRAMLNEHGEEVEVAIRVVPPPKCDKHVGLYNNRNVRCQALKDEHPDNVHWYAEGDIKITWPVTDG
jgi:hypothetical protein